MNLLTKICHKCEEYLPYSKARDLAAGITQMVSKVESNVFEEILKMPEFDKFTKRPEDGDYEAHTISAMKEIFEQFNQGFYGRAASRLSTKLKKSEELNDSHIRIIRDLLDIIECDYDVDEHPEELPAHYWWALTEIREHEERRNND